MGTPWQSCCWRGRRGRAVAGRGRCGGVAGWGAAAEMLMAGRYGGAVAGRGAVAERLLRGGAVEEQLQRGGAVAEMLAAA